MSLHAVETSLASAHIETRSCEVCGGNAARVLYRQRFAPLSDDIGLTEYDVAVCTRCGFGFADGIPAQAAFDRYYREMSKYGNHETEGGAREGATERNRQTVAQIIRRLPKRPSSILDIGCANGHLLGVFKSEGYSNLLGLDPSPASAEAARRLYDVEVVTGSLTEPPLKGRRFDLVIVQAVLEHLRDVRSCVANAAELLSEGGALFVEVPNVLGFDRYSSLPYQQFSLEHINFFSPHSLTNLLGTVGLEPIDFWVLADHFVDISWALFRATNKRRPAEVVYDSSTESAILEYIERSDYLDRLLQERIDDAALRQGPVIIWGVGTLSRRLLAGGAFDRLDISAFVDSNANYQGRQIGGKKVLAPVELSERGEAIAIAAPGYQGEILNFIRGTLGLSNHVVPLFPAHP